MTGGRPSERLNIRSSSSRFSGAFFLGAPSKNTQASRVTPPPLKMGGGVPSYPFAFAIAALAAVQQNSRRQSLPHDTTTAAHQFHKLQLLFHCYHPYQHMIGLRICVRVSAVNSAPVRWSVTGNGRLTEFLVQWCSNRMPSDEI